MTRILLTTTALVAFAGAAVAESHTGVTFTGTAELGYNDNAVGDNDGFYSDLDIIAGFLTELDNGLTASATLDLEDLADSADGVAYELALTSETAGLFYGDTAFAADNIWISAGDMEGDGFSEADGEEAIRGEVRYGNVDAQVSYVLANNEGTRNVAEDANQLSIGVSADFGNWNVIAAYQDSSDEVANFYSSDDGAAVGPTGSNGDFNDNEVYGLSVATTFAGASVRLAYADDSVTDSTGLEIAYPYGPVTTTVYYVSESVGQDNWGLNFAYSDGPVAVTLDYQDDQGSEDWGLEGSFEVGNGLQIFAGIDDSGDDYYAGGTYDLGGGTELQISYAEDDSSDAGDEIGDQEYQEGTTVEISFEF